MGIDLIALTCNSLKMKMKRMGGIRKIDRPARIFL